jgi:hypothetical protein
MKANFGEFQPKSLWLFLDIPSEWYEVDLFLLLHPKSYTIFISLLHFTLSRLFQSGQNQLSGEPKIGSIV